jgi:hypothetical protein
MVGKRLQRALLWLVCATAASTAFAQGVQTGTLQGTVSDSSGAVLPGVTVRVSSLALQGERTTVTDENGHYVIRGLPAGSYRVVTELADMKTVKLTASVDVGQISELNATMEVGGVAETITVSGASVASEVTTTSTGANYKYAEITALPSGRGIQQIASLAPGLTTNTPNAGQVTISGAFAYDNVFLMDGVDINDNLFGTANNLFIEDALEETQVLTSGISAEYGRFSGGVINAVSKSGGDSFTGSWRLNLTNDAWQKRSPFEIREGQDRADKVNRIHEGTFGGPMVRTKLWFFTAGRFLETENTAPLPTSGVPFTTTNNEQRGEIKLTGTVENNHTLTGSYLKLARDVARVAFPFSIDPNVAEYPNFPNDRWVIGYRGVLSPRLLSEVRWSRKAAGIRDVGGTSTDIVESPFFGLSEVTHYNAPYFDATDPEDRNNWQMAGTLSYFLTTPSWGSHDVKSGVEVFQSSRTGGNSQSSTGYVFDADYLQDASGDPIFDGQGRFVPVFVPGETFFENWLPTRGAVVDIRTTSLFLQDSWRAGRQWTFDLGLRYERVRSEATGNIVSVDTDTWVPRLAASYDIRGDGRLVAQTTYAWYAGKYSESQVANNTDVGNPSQVLALYTGPAGQGRDFAPGFDPANYETFSADFPTANVFVGDGLSSPVNKEFTVSLGTQLGRGYLKGTYINRQMNNFIEDFIDLSTGETTVVRDGIDYGTFSNVLFTNSDIPERNYQALQFQARYQFTDRWWAYGNWTVQLENDGNFEGEAANQPGISSVLGDFPEARDPARHYPLGRLDDFQRHKIRAWTLYDVGLGKFGDASLAWLWNYNSPRVYSLAATNVPLTPTQLGLVADYASEPDPQTLFFRQRGSEEFEDAHTFDFGLHYYIPVFRTLRPYLKFDVFNVFNEDKLTSWNTVVRADPASPLDSLGLPTGYIEGAQFGQGQSNNNYPVARRWQIAFGVRF